MKNTERFANSLESLLLAMVMAWTITIGVALVAPEVRRAPAGVVEVYSMILETQHSGT
jgi:hypothetical protein